MVGLMNNRRAWVRIVEAFFAILIVMGMALFVINKDSGQAQASETDYQNILRILRVIEVNSSARGEILSVGLPVKWEDFDSEGLGNVKNKVIDLQPNYLNCSAMICEIDDTCEQSVESNESVYAIPVGIYANLSTYSPRQLKLFCEENL